MWRWKNVVLYGNRFPALASCWGIYPHLNYSSLPSQNVCRAWRTLDINVQPKRCTTFFNKLTADELWKGCTSVSNAGKKRGRGKGTGRKSTKDLNKGQIIGVGKANIQWPGLNVPVMRGKELVQQQKLPEDPEREKKLIELRDQMGAFRPIRLSPIERGWSGAKMPGRSIGPPDPIGEDEFEGFDSRVLELKMVVTMKGNLGRRRRISTLVVTGNRNGLVGFASGKANEAKSSLRSAKNRAGQRLMHVDLYNNHTVYHDFFCQFGKTKIFVKKKPEGYGLVCHRAIITICQVLGIKDLHAKIEGPTNLRHIVKAFFTGLVQQKTHQQLAEEKQLHLVEFRKECDYFPEVKASPMKCRLAQEVKAGEILDFTQHVMGDRVVLKKKKFPPFYTKLPSYQVYLKKQENIRNHDKVRLRLRAEYGEVRSFLTDKYPECKPHCKEPNEENAEA